MSRIVLFSLCAAVTLACAPRPASAPGSGAASEACLSIVSWNDLHGQLEPEAVWVDLHKVPAGGVVALADHLDALRGRGEPVIALDAGDLFTGPMESTTSEGAPVIAAYRALGVDAAALGNHEFDFGPVGYERVVAASGKTDADGADGPRGALLRRLADASFPFLSANLRTTTGAAPAWPNVKPWTLIERGGFRVGVVGYSTKETPTTTLKPNVDGLTFEVDAVERVRTAIVAARAAGAAPVVLVAHASLDGELPQDLADDQPRAGELAALFAGLGSDLPDLAVAGHRHAWMVGRVRGVPVVSSDQHAVGHAVSRFCRGSNGRISFRSVERRVTFASPSPATPLGKQVQAAVQPWIDAVRAQADAVVATVPRACAAQGPTGTAMQEAIATAILDRARKDGLVAAGATAVAVVNAGGVRMPIAAGPVRQRDLFAVLPFENAISTCTTTRAGLTKAFGNLARRLSVRDRFPFGVAGATVRAHRTAEAPLVIDVIEPTGAGDEIALVMPDFLLFGGDSFLEGVTCSATRTSPVRIRDAYAAALPALGGCDGAARNVKVE